MLKRTGCLVYHDRVPTAFEFDMAIMAIFFTRTQPFAVPTLSIASGAVETSARADWFSTVGFSTKSTFGSSSQAHTLAMSSKP